MAIKAMRASTSGQLLGVVRASTPAAANATAAETKNRAIAPDWQTEAPTANHAVGCAFLQRGQREYDHLPSECLAELRQGSVFCAAAEVGAADPRMGEPSESFPSSPSSDLLIG